MPLWNENVVIQHTPEESARRILATFFKKFGARAGVIMVRTNFETLFVVDGWTISDFERGLDFAMDREWVVMVPPNIKLMQAGLDVINPPAS